MERRPPEANSRLDIEEIPPPLFYGIRRFIARAHHAKGPA
jgi:hypothetical protein